MISPVPVLFVQGYQDRAGLLGGGQISLLQLMGGLDRKRFQPRLACPEGKLVTYARQSGIETVRLTFPPLGSGALSGWAATIRGLARVIKSEGVRLIHANDPRGMAYAGLVGRLCRVPVLWHVRTVNPNRALERLMSHLASGIVVVSEAVGRRFGRTASGKVQVIYNGVDVSGVIPRRDVRAVRREFSFEGRQVVGVVARLIPWKGHRAFLEAASLVAEKRQGVGFLIVGGDVSPEERYRGELVALADRLGLGRQVVFTGFREDVPDLLASLDVLVLPSLLEDPLPRVVLEAMALSRPVVASAVGGIPEIVVDGKTGFLVPPGAPPRMAEAIVALLEDPALATKMGEAGRNRVETRFSLQSHVTAVQAFYERLLEGKA